MIDQYELKKSTTRRYKKITTVLHTIYGYTSFKPKQYEIINNIVSGNDVCAILSTGYGKSICYQIPAIYIDKPAIVISPLIALMNDQIMGLRDVGISCCCYNSTVTDKPKLMDDILSGKYRIVYITPESIIKKIDLIMRLHTEIGISLIAIDEAHCISSYGFQFRPSYRGLSILKQTIPDVPILALTATATQTVIDDISTVLCLRTPTIIALPFNRENLFIQVSKKTKGNKESAMGLDVGTVLSSVDRLPAIVYCISRNETSLIASAVHAKLNVKCVSYHAGLSSEDRESAHQKFITGDADIIVATTAYGMGINKSDVRTIVHYGAPGSIEGYYQEIGRAGRDGGKSLCVLFYSDSDFYIHELLAKNTESQNSDTSYIHSRQKYIGDVKSFVKNTDCRKKTILGYFGERIDKCNMCDICVPSNYVNESCPSIKHDVDVTIEATMLINTMMSFSTKHYGANMFINILRGSNNKSMNSAMKAHIHYGKGKHKPVLWWKALIDALISLKYISTFTMKTNTSIIPIIKPTQIGISTISKVEFGMLGPIIITM